MNEAIEKKKKKNYFSTFNASRNEKKMK